MGPEAFSDSEKIVAVEAALLGPWCWKVCCTPC